MSAVDDFAALLQTAEAIKQILQSVREEPAHLLGIICREYQTTGKAVPDHNLHPVGYLGEASLSALISLGLIKRHSGERLSLYSYEPTAEGLKQYERLRAEGFYQR